MNDNPNPRSRHPWRLALIPIGFLVLIGGFLLYGEYVQETTDSSMDDTVEEAME